MIAFTFPSDKRAGTKNDKLALGFVANIQAADDTSTRVDGSAGSNHNDGNKERRTKKRYILLRIDSGSSDDYLQLEMDANGHVAAVYNLGTEDHHVTDGDVKVNDGRYHVVRFTRLGSSASLQIDHHDPVALTPLGRQLTIFNSHSTIQIGGRRNKTAASSKFASSVFPRANDEMTIAERPFSGIIAGFVFNGHRILDMAAENDPRVQVDGNVQLLMSIKHALRSDDKSTRVAVHDSNVSDTSSDYVQMQQVISKQCILANDRL